MENFAYYIKNIFCLYIILTVIDNLATNEKYRRYIRFFCGILMIIVIMKPVFAAFSVDSFILDGIFPDEYKISDDVYREIMRAEKERSGEIVEAYYGSIEGKVEEYVEDWGYSLIDIEVSLNLDTDSSDYGKIMLIRIILVKNGNDSEMDADAYFMGYDIISIKNNLANFYNIPMSNIYITVQKPQEGAEK